MNIKDLLLPLGLALLTTWAIQYFFLQRYTGPEAQTDAASFVAPTSQQECNPLNKEIDFLDEKRPRDAVVTAIETPWADLEFSTDGASLQRLEFKRTINGDVQQLGTIFPLDETKREQRCFLVSLAEKTPFYYQFVDRKENETTIDLTYRVTTNAGTITKTFAVHKDKPQIDLVLDVAPKADNPIDVRIFYPSPIMPELAENDVISSVVIDRNGTFKKTGRASIEPERGWTGPTLFGSDNRYFVFALVDGDTFVQRAYYQLVGQNELFSILEGPVVSTKNNWKMSFYLGPKEAGAMLAVDSRLEKALDYYGWFAPISKGMLAILKWLQGYLHNYGLAIIVLTFLLRLLMFPFSIQSERGAKQRQEMQKKLAYLQQRYKDNPQALAQARAEFMQKHGMAGLGIGSCLPLLLQMPIFFGLSRVLANSIELYQAPMLWISDLSSRDPYYIFPILVTIGMLAQAAGTDPKQRLSIVGMAFVFGAITASLSAGLALYISVSTLLAVAQTKLLKIFKVVR